MRRPTIVQINYWVAIGKCEHHPVAEDQLMGRNAQAGFAEMEFE